MENYESQPCHIEHEADLDPFDDPMYFHIEVLQDKSIKSLVNRALKNFGPGKPLVWFAEGRAASKAVSCAEILKSYYKKPVHQITKVNQMRTMETWAPLIQELDCLKVTRSVPMIYILLSLEPLEVKSSGYQKSSSRQSKRTITMSELEAALAEECFVPSPSPSPKEINSKSPPPTPSQ